MNKDTKDYIKCFIGFIEDGSKLIATMSTFTVIYIIAINSKYVPEKELLFIGMCSGLIYFSMLAVKLNIRAINELVLRPINQSKDEDTPTRHTP